MFQLCRQFLFQRMALTLALTSTGTETVVGHHLSDYWDLWVRFRQHMSLALKELSLVVGGREGNTDKKSKCNIVE